MDKKSRATLWVRDGWIHCRTPYHEDFIMDLKNDIPHSARKYNRDEKIWLVEASYAEDLEKIVRKYFGEPTVVMNEVHVQAGATEDVYSAFLRVLPNAVLIRLYKTAALELHPDRGGDPQVMSQMNAAWAEIKKERKL